RVSALHTRDRALTDDPPNAPWRVPMRLVPIGGEADAGARALPSVGKIGIERWCGIVDRTWPHALGRVEQLNLVGAADHHRVLGRPIEILPVRIGFVLIGGTAGDR